MSTAESTNSVDDDGEKSVKLVFLKAFKLFRNLTGDYDGETTTKEYQEKIQNCIKLCEDITHAVTSLEMFSVNEALEELPTNHIKFLILPFMLGSLWQLKIEKERRDICVASQIYFQDFLQRLFDYGIIKSLPSVMEQEQDEEKKKKKPTVSSDDVRALKIAKLKENKALDLKIKTILEKQEDWSFDEETARELFLTLIQRYHNESIQELEAISKEIDLINYSISSKKKEGDSSTVSQSSSSGSQQSTRGNGIQTFILTRTNLEKKVFGEGYPALPVMTVEELYAQRRADGTWGPPPNPNSNGPVLTEEEQAELEAAIKESQEEADDPVRLQQARNMDEYKDMHRRGWGNRANRS